VSCTGNREAQKSEQDIKNSNVPFQGVCEYNGERVRCLSAENGSVERAYDLGVKMESSTRSSFL